MTDILRPILELSVIIPGILLAYFPMQFALKPSFGKLMCSIIPLFGFLCAVGGIICSLYRIPTMPMLAALTLLAAVIYVRTLHVSPWKSVTVALSVCAVFACLNSLARAVNAIMLTDKPTEQNDPWLCLGAAVCYVALCSLSPLVSYYPATHRVQDMIKDENFAQTWYVFWVLPLVFIALNLFMIPKYSATLYTGRVLQGYFVLSIVLLILLIWFYMTFLLIAIGLNRNARLRQENQLLFLQQQRYESLQNAIDEARQARHDMRHQLIQISALADDGDLEGIKAYLSRAVSKIPTLDMHYCENRAADSVIGYYGSLAKRDGIPFFAEIDLPEKLPIDEMNLCLILSNLLENAREASLRTDPKRQNIRITAYLHSDSMVLIQTKNAFDGTIRINNGVFRSSKRKGNGIGLQSVCHIAEKSGGICTFSHQDGIFCAKVMLRG